MIPIMRRQAIPEQEALAIFATAPVIVRGDVIASYHMRMEPNEKWSSLPVLSAGS